MDEAQHIQQKSEKNVLPVQQKVNQGFPTLLALWIGLCRRWKNYMEELVQNADVGRCSGSKSGAQIERKDHPEMSSKRGRPLKKVVGAKNKGWCYYSFENARGALPTLQTFVSVCFLEKCGLEVLIQFFAQQWSHYKICNLIKYLSNWMIVYIKLIAIRCFAILLPSIYATLENMSLLSQWLLKQMPTNTSRHPTSLTKAKMVTINVDRKFLLMYSQSSLIFHILIAEPNKIIVSFGNASANHLGDTRKHISMVDVKSMKNIKIKATICLVAIKLVIQTRGLPHKN